MTRVDDAAGGKWDVRRLTGRAPGRKGACLQVADAAEPVLARLLP